MEAPGEVAKEDEEVASPVQIKVVDSLAQVVVEEYSLLILAWIVEVVISASEEVDSTEVVDSIGEVVHHSVATEGPLVAETAVEASEEVSEIIEDIFNAFMLDGNLHHDS